MIFHKVKEEHYFEIVIYSYFEMNLGLDFVRKLVTSSSSTAKVTRAVIETDFRIATVN